MRKGFTLVELAMVMVVIGLVIGGGIQMMSVMSQRAKITEAKQQISILKEGIIGFVQTNGVLPTAAEFSTIGNVIDPWGKPILYIPSQKLGNTTDICNFSISDLNVSNFVNSIDVAFVLVSSGENYNMQTRVRTAGTPDDVRIYPPSQAIDDNTTDFNRATDEYDDMYTFVTLQELKTKTGCSQTPLSLIPISLPIADDNSTYNIEVNASGGIRRATPANRELDWCWTILPQNGFVATATSGVMTSSTDSCNANGWRQSTGITISKAANTGVAGTMSNVVIYVRDIDGYINNHSYSIPMN